MNDHSIAKHAGTQVWNEARLTGLISSRAEEGLSLEYKSASAFGNAEKVKHEITKNVSAFSNSAGGVLIYGIREGDDPDKRHLPERIEPIDRREYPREWLEQIVNTIRPIPEGVVITPVTLSTGEHHVVYVIEIPQGTKAHQAADYIYYRRYNFQVLRMADHEIADINHRARYPKLDVQLFVESQFDSPMPNKPPHKRTYLRVVVDNNGPGLVNFLMIFIGIPKRFVPFRKWKDAHGAVDVEGEEYLRFFQDNADGSGFFPLLPGLGRSFKIEVEEQITSEEFKKCHVHLDVSADAAPMRLLGIPLSSIKESN